MTQPPAQLTFKKKDNEILNSNLQFQPTLDLGANWLCSRNKRKKKQKWRPSLRNDNSNALRAIRLLNVSNIRQDIFEHTLERNRMLAKFLAARCDSHDPMS
jgi:hypothetical protein